MNIKKVLCAGVLALASLVVPRPAQAQVAGATMTVSVTNVAANVTTTIPANQLVIRENSASPSAVFSITLSGSATAINFAAGATYTFQAQNGQTWPAGTVIGTIIATTAGPFTFVGTQSVGQASQQAKAGSSSSGGSSSFPLTVSGTVNSGGIPCFTSGTQESSSATIAANTLIKGGGAGACASASSITDNGTTVATSEPIAVGGGASCSGSPSLCMAAQLGTSTNCAATGTAASPSLVACTAAPAGAFSCSATASAGTCVVSDTAVTANSEILVTLNESEGTRLSVTCNTSITVGTVPVLLSKSAGASFTVNVPTITTNPACYDFLIVN
jgi:hypothetical protein